VPGAIEPESHWEDPLLTPHNQRNDRERPGKGGGRRKKGEQQHAREREREEKDYELGSVEDNTYQGLEFINIYRFVYAFQKYISLMNKCSFGRKHISLNKCSCSFGRKHNISLNKNVRHRTNVRLGETHFSK